MANQGGNVNEKEVRLAVDLYACKVIPDENLEVPEFKLKVVILDHVGDILEK